MSNTTQTAKVLAAIADLEAKAAAMVSRRAELQTDLQTAYIEGTDTAKISGELDKLARELPTTVDVLRGLDHKLVEVSHAENQGERDRLRAEAAKRYTTARRELEKSLKPLGEVAHRHLPDAKTMLAQVKGDVARAAWLAINSDFADRYVAEVPSAVSAIPKRDADGHRVTTGRVSASA